MYKINQIFENNYPPEAAVWCNENKAYIDEISEGKFQIKVIPSPTKEELSNQARNKRDQLLRETDYLFREDYPITLECKEEFKVYCQALRDITLQPGFPEEIKWPTKPEVKTIPSEYEKSLMVSRENTYEL